jgi:hypothetical protein
VGTYWQQQGVSVLPVISFGTPVRYVRQGSAWAIRGATDGEWRELLTYWAVAARPGLIVIFGRHNLEESFLGIPILSRRLVSRQGSKSGCTE